VEVRHLDTEDVMEEVRSVEEKWKYCFSELPQDKQQEFLKALPQNQVNVEANAWTTSPPRYVRYKGKWYKIIILINHRDPKPTDC
jgi:hypothetical protein